MSAGAGDAVTGLRCWHGGTEHSWEPGEACPPTRTERPLNMYPIEKKSLADSIIEQVWR